MKPWKVVFTFFIFALLTIRYSLFPTSVLAENEFTTDSLVTYTVQENGKTSVSHDITLENNFSTLYATTYSLILENIEAVSISATEEVKGKWQDIKVDVAKDGDKTKIKVNFIADVVGKGAKRHFIIKYENGNFAIRTGEVWEISIPRLAAASSFRNYTVNLVVPDSFGLEAYVSPKPDEYNHYNNYKNYKFYKPAVTQTGITAGFGEFQVFSFTLNYHLENPLSKSAQTQIALPPDTAFQKVLISKLDPMPANIDLDSDGNWLATYNLKPRERMDVVAMGTVQIFASYRPFVQPTDETLSANLKTTEFWQVDDPQIVSLATKLKTPRAIYDYVASSLKYDLERVQPNVQRIGAVSVLNNPTQAICMEFTDLFVALTRAAGIPAREVNGYAYTENPDLQPLGLVADVLHSWPEYYDKEVGAWIPVDPTWGSTTGGQDFFSKLDLRHFAFVIHGKDPVKPYAPGSYKLGPNPQKDVFVSFGKLPEERFSKPRLLLNSKKLMPLLDSKYSILIQNPGPSALYSLSPTVYFDNNLKNTDFIEVMPPYSSTKLEITTPFSLLGKNTPDVIKVIVQGETLEIPTNKTQLVITTLLMLSILFLLILIWVLVSHKRISIDRFTAKIRGIYEKFSKRTEKSSP